MINIMTTLIVAFVGAWIALRLKVPAGAMIGAMLLVGLFNIATDYAFIPNNIRIIIQISAGAFIGARVQYKDVLDLRYMFKPAILMIIGMLSITFVMAIFMYQLMDIDLVTSFFACAPGGIVDMSLISQDMGADASKVAILHLVRVISVIGIFPPILKIVSSRFGKQIIVNEPEDSYENPENNTVKYNTTQEPEKTFKEKTINLTITSVVALLAGFLGYMLGVPAGAIMFSMIAVAAVGILFKRSYLPIRVRTLTQVFAGALIGESMTYADLISLKSVMLPAFMLLIGLMMMNLCIGLLINKISKLDLATSLFACAPGGVADMALIAQEFGADAPKIALLQLTRLTSVIAFFPVFIKYVSMLF